MPDWSDDRQHISSGLFTLGDDYCVGLFIFGQTACQSEFSVYAAACDRHVEFVCKITADDLVESLESRGCLAEQNTSCRIPVQPVCGSRGEYLLSSGIVFPFLNKVIFHLVGEMILLLVPVAMCQKTVRLGYDQDIIIFVDNPISDLIIWLVGFFF